MEKKIIGVFAALVLVYLVGFGIDVMDIDASQYASISREMMLSGSYLQVFELGKDYLDKPPFLFWVSALSMKLFGVNNFAYRLPSMLFSLLTLYSTYKFCLLYYKKEIALMAALVLASCQAFFLINHDVRTDTILMSWSIFSIWQLACWFKTKKNIHFFIGCFGIAGGMLTKGPIALLVPIFAFGSHFMLMRNFKMFFKWQYIAGIVVIAFFLLPMCIGLYQQFDLNPQKTVNGKTGVSGLRFFFWTQSFGRITGESTWNNNKNIFFLFQNLLWGFLPWIFVFIAALYVELKSLVVKKGKILESEEWICMGGFIVSYLALGTSHYQLPHYIYIVLPFASIITAKFLYRLVFQNEYPRLLRFFEKSHFVIFVLIWILLLVLLLYCFSTPLWISLAATVSFIFFLTLFYRKKSNSYFLKMGIFSFICINLFLNLAVYPSLLQYQAGSNIGRWIHKSNLPKKQLFIYQSDIGHSIQFYSNALITHKDSLAQVQPGDYIITSKEKLADLTSANLVFDIKYETDTYKVSQLKLTFINPSTRKKTVTPFVVIKIK